MTAPSEGGVEAAPTQKERDKQHHRRKEGKGNHTKDSGRESRHHRLGRGREQRHHEGEADNMTQKEEEGVRAPHARRRNHETKTQEKTTKNDENMFNCCHFFHFSWVFVFFRFWHFFAIRVLRRQISNIKYSYILGPPLFLGPGRSQQKMTKKTITRT